MPGDRFDYHLVVPVWGERYTRLCRDFLLASLLAPGNLPALAAGRRVSLVFCCPPATRAILEPSPAFAAAAGIVEAGFIDNADLLERPETKYRAMTESHHRAIAAPGVAPGHTVLVFLNPDLVLSEGALAGVRAALEGGRRAVMVTGPRTRLDRMPAALAPWRAGPVLALPGPTLARAALGCLHPASEAFIWNRGSYVRSWAALLFYETAGGGLLQHCFHLHPLALVCPDPVPATRDSIDGAFLEECGFGPADFLVVEDTRTIVMVEVSGEPYAPVLKPGPPSAQTIADFAVRHAGEVHWHFFDHRIAFLPAPGLPPACPELDAIVRHVRCQRFRRKMPRFDRLILRHVLRRLYAVGLIGRGLSRRPGGLRAAGDSPPARSSE